MREVTAVHVDELAGDYILGLLPADKMSYVNTHIAGCLTCRQLVRVEREIGLLTRETLLTVGKMDPQRLQELMPMPPRTGVIHPILWHWQKQLAVAALIVLIIMGSITLGFNRRNATWPTASPAYQNVNTTVADTPTWTITATVYEDRPEEGSATAASISGNLFGKFLMATPDAQKEILPKPAVVAVPVAPFFNNEPGTIQ